jgi:nicotinamide riboside transporter PnuC
LQQCSDDLDERRTDAASTENSMTYYNITNQKRVYGFVTYGLVTAASYCRWKEQKQKNKEEMENEETKKSRETKIINN